MAEALCRVEEPQLREVAPGHRVACHLTMAGDQAQGREPALISSTGTYLGYSSG